jgi:hypothetical protein
MSVKLSFSTYSNLLCLLTLVSSATADDAMIERVPVVSKGWWLFKNYTATFPSQLVDSNFNKSVYIDKIETNDTLHISLSFIADTPIQFVDFDPIIEFSVVTKHGLVFRSNRRVFSHYFRMSKEGKSLWPRSDEWLCAFDLGVEYKNRAIPFSYDLPAKTNQIKCNLSIENPKQRIEVDIRCLSCSTNVPVTAVLEFTSSWK